MRELSIKENLKITNEKAGTKWNHKGLRKRHLNAINFINDYIPKEKNIPILDAGCREGLFLDKLVTLGYKNLYGIDISDKAIKIMKKNVGDVKGFIGDVSEMPFKDNLFELVICTHTLEHCIDPYKALYEIFRISKNNCLVLLEVPIENVDSPRTSVGHFSKFTTEKEFLEFASKKMKILKRERDDNVKKHWFRILGRIKK